MKLLLDQNLPRQLIGPLQAIFPGTTHVGGLNMAEATDEEVWSYALREEFVIVSKDTDFIHQAMLKGHPPKVIYLKIGNCSASAARDVLFLRLGTIREFLADPIVSLLIVQ